MGGDVTDPGSSHRPDSTEKLFRDTLVTSARPRSRAPLGMGSSVVAHIAALSVLLLVPVFRAEPLPDQANPFPVLFFEPPAAAAPPLPLGSPMRKPRPTQPMARDSSAQQLTIPTPETPTEEAPLLPEDKPQTEDPFGSETGSAAGVPESMEGGVDGGPLGGIPTGDPRGCVGCTGDGPVRDEAHLSPGRLHKEDRGIVTVQFLIDMRGEVGHVRVIHSVPMLDQAAIETVRRWRFTPAVKKGRAVATLATAPISFKIF